MTDKALDWMSREDWRGGCSGPVAEACDYAREIAQEWGERMVVRFDGARTNHPDGTPNDPNGRLLWTIFAATEEGPR